MKDNSSTIVENGTDATIAAIPCYVPCGLELNKIYNESNLDTMKRMPDNFVDLTVTSPPYDGLRTYNGYSFPFEEIAQELYRVTKQGGVLVWVVSDATTNGTESGTSFRQALFFKECGFNLHDTMIYHKHSPPLTHNRYEQHFEYMFILSKGKPKTINLINDRKNKESRCGDNGTKRLENGELLKVKRGGYSEYGRRTNIWEYGIGKGQSTKDDVAFKHPAIFPEQLATDHIISWSNENDLVYDPFMGSGTTAKMSILNTRNWIGSEISNEYCDIIEERVKKAWEEKRKEKDLTQKTLFGDEM
jgi:site-specific DNA-methyltransferase (adenine-specific)